MLSQPTRLHARLVLAVSLLGLAGCHPGGQAAAPAPDTPSPMQVYTQFAQGDTLNLVRTQLQLSDKDVRYHSGMPEGRMSMVYFLGAGNLHVEVTKVGETWVLLTAPFLEPSSEPVGTRLAEWDRGADAQEIKMKRDR